MNRRTFLKSAAFTALAIPLGYVAHNGAGSRPERLITPYVERLSFWLGRRFTFLPMPAPPRVDGKSQVFRVDNCPQPRWENRYHEGVDALLDLMGRGGVKLYRSSISSTLAGPDGILGRDDVILIKINAQWPQRGMTNTDLLRGLIQRLIEHPDAFRGEIVLVDNGQGQGNHLTSPNQNNDDSPGHTQSARAVVDNFRRDVGEIVSLYDWAEVRERFVDEYIDDDDRDGYVQIDDPLNYPKFTTPRGTKVSLRHGLWNGSSYESDRLKLINVPVLKAHAMFGTTAAVKNYVGVISPRPQLQWDFHDSLHRTWKGKPPGLLGGALDLRFPVLNLVDATYVALVNNYACPYDDTPYVGSIVASVDPVAVDYHVSKHILLPRRIASGVPNAQWSDPDVVSIFGQYLLATQSRLLALGRLVRFGDDGIDLIQRSLG